VGWSWLKHHELYRGQVDFPRIEAFASVRDWGKGCTWPRNIRRSSGGGGGDVSPHCIVEWKKRVDGNKTSINTKVRPHENEKVMKGSGWNEALCNTMNEYWISDFAR
jgi:hypothetical protein